MSAKGAWLILCGRWLGSVVILQVVSKQCKEMLLLRARPCGSSEQELCGRGTPLADTHQAPLQLPVKMLLWRVLRMSYDMLALSLINRGVSESWNIPAVKGVPLLHDSPSISWLFVHL